MPHIPGHTEPDLDLRFQEEHFTGGGEVVPGTQPTGPIDPTGGGSGADRFTNINIGGLGLGGLFQGTTLEDSWQKYFDPYDDRREQFLTEQRNIDLRQQQEQWGLKSGQLESAWDLAQTSLGDTWNLQQSQLAENWQTQLGGLGESFRLQSGSLGEQWQATQAGMGAQARQGLGQVTQMGQQMAQRGRGLTFGGEKERQARGSVEEDYQRRFGSAQGAYQRALAGTTAGYKQGITQGEQRYGQAIETGQQRYDQAIAKGQLGFDQAMAAGALGLRHGAEDIGQRYESDVVDMRSAWERRQKDLAFQMLGMGIFEDTT